MFEEDQKWEERIRDYPRQQSISSGSNSSGDEEEKVDKFVKSVDYVQLYVVPQGRGRSLAH